MPRRRYNLRSGGLPSLTPEESFFSWMNEASTSSPQEQNDVELSANYFLATQTIDQPENMIYLTNDSTSSATVDCGKLSSDLLDQYGMIDLSRIPPRITLQEKSARTALRAEIDGILQKDAHGIPIGMLSQLNSGTAQKHQKLHCAIITKVKEMLATNADCA